MQRWLHCRVCRLSCNKAQALLRQSAQLAGVPLLAALDDALALLAQDSEDGFQVVGGAQDPLQRWLRSGPLRDWRAGLPVLTWDWQQQGWEEGGRQGGVRLAAATSCGLDMTGAGLFPIHCSFLVDAVAAGSPLRA
jgi:hypothetical protein